MASLQASALQKKKLNPNAEPFVYLRASQCPNPFVSPPVYYLHCHSPSQLYYSSPVHLEQASTYGNYWYSCLASHPLQFSTSRSPFNGLTNGSCTGEFDSKKCAKPKLAELPKVEEEPWKLKTQGFRRRRFPCRFAAGKAPVPEPKVQLKDASSVDLNELEAECERSTVMIKNIPGRLTRKMLLELLDNHCMKENEKASSSSPSEYDFVYLPIDFRQKLNLGYAFVNFTTPRAAKLLYESMNNFKWDSFGSKKICEITYANIQGKDALVRHFKNKNFKCDSDKFLPILLSPARNGSTSRPFPSVVGILRAPLVKTKGREGRFCLPNPP